MSLLNRPIGCAPLSVSAAQRHCCEAGSDIKREADAKFRAGTTDFCPEHRRHLSGRSPFGAGSRTPSRDGEPTSTSRMSPVILSDLPASLTAWSFGLSMSTPRNRGLSLHASLGPLANPTLSIEQARRFNPL